MSDIETQVEPLIFVFFPHTLFFYGLLALCDPSLSLVVCIILYLFLWITVVSFSSLLVRQSKNYYYLQFLGCFWPSSINICILFFLCYFMERRNALMIIVVDSKK